MFPNAGTGFPDFQPDIVNFTWCPGVEDTNQAIDGPEISFGFESAREIMCLTKGPVCCRLELRDMAGCQDILFGCQGTFALEIADWQLLQNLG